jgi:two-component system KDP operon response regulator KdpE
MPTILLADDDQALRSAVTTLLEASGYSVEATSSGAETLDRWPRTHPDLLIVDLHMPGGGEELVKTIATDTSVPVIVLSADDREEVKVAALDAGAEDYVTKPFSAAELLARIRVVLRRGGKPDEDIQIGPVRLSPNTYSVGMHGHTVSLTPTEFDLLKKLAETPGFITTADLLAEVWGPAYQTEQEYVRAYVRRIRSKLESIGLPDAIESRPGVGYRLRHPQEPRTDGPGQIR